MVNFRLQIRNNSPRSTLKRTAEHWKTQQHVQIHLAKYHCDHPKACPPSQGACQAHRTTVQDISRAVCTGSRGGLLENRTSTRLLGERCTRLFIKLTQTGFASNVDATRYL
jgi:hypothetical protein